MTQPWKVKQTIDLALSLADANGFRLGEHHYWPDAICLFTKGANEHGFANDIVLESFRDWPEVVCWFAGWNKRDLVAAIDRSKRSKK